MGYAKKVGDKYTDSKKWTVWNQTFEAAADNQ